LACYKLLRCKEKNLGLAGKNRLFSGAASLVTDCALQGLAGVCARGCDMASAFIAAVRGHTAFTVFVLWR
jgi:hypothetical protein